LDRDSWFFVLFFGDRKRQLLLFIEIPFSKEIINCGNNKITEIIK
jgi:hypothetical protein